MPCSTTRRFAARRTERGVTRVEALLAFLMVVGLAGAAAAFTGATGERGPHPKASARTVLTAASTWLERDDRPGCPTVSRLVKDGTLDSNAEGDDPWGGRFSIVCASDGALRVESPGPDGERGTGDDLVVTE